MICPVCLYVVDASGPVYPKHVNSLMAVCGMSGQPTFEWDEYTTRAAVAGRSNGICEFCGENMATDMHHRLARSLGGQWHPANIIHLCRRCHSRCTSPSGTQREWAIHVGLLLKTGDDPAAIPVIRMSQLWLSDDVAPPIRDKRRTR